MQALQLHADQGLPVTVHTAQLPWLASPQAGVERKMLERVGGEVALASSIVRYAAKSNFPAHVHEMGEEFLVLSGTFSDEYGHYPVGSYVRNPPGSSHSPFSDGGCIIFVKLRQMALSQNRRVVISTAQMHWREWPAVNGICQCSPLYTDAHEAVYLLRLEAGCTIPAQVTPGGAELLVLEGMVTMTDAKQALSTWSWARQPQAELPAIYSADGAMLWVKRGHLRSAAQT